MNPTDEIPAVEPRNGASHEAPHEAAHEALRGKGPGVADVLANLKLANEIACQNIAQQNAVAFQQAMFQLQLAAVGKCSQLILSIDPADPDAASKLALYRDLFDTFIEKFRTSSDPGRISP